MFRDGNFTKVPLHTAFSGDLHEGIDEILAYVTQHFTPHEIVAVGHRVVHGGDRFAGPTRISSETIGAIEELVPLDPLHQPQSVKLIKAIALHWPKMPQTASFDTAFHRSQDDMTRRFALPRSLFEQGMKRFGFHGLSYKYIAGELDRLFPEYSKRRVVVAHLGSGASLCALHGGLSRDTSMAFSTLDGIPMATRCGALDPGVIIHLIKQLGWSIDRVEDLLYNKSGLLGISDISGDTRVLGKSAHPSAREALDIFAFRVSREIAGLANSIGGMEVLVFTAGIGANQPGIRDDICKHLGWLGVEIDPSANIENATRIDVHGSKVSVFVIQTDEEQVIADEASQLLELKC